MELGAGFKSRAVFAYLSMKERRYTMRLIRPSLELCERFIFAPPNSMSLIGPNIPNPIFRFLLLTVCFLPMHIFYARRAISFCLAPSWKTAFLHYPALTRISLGRLITWQLQIAMTWVISFLCLFHDIHMIFPGNRASKMW